jgi:hypothetical protein
VSVQRLRVIAALSVLVAQLGGCHSCLKEEEPPPKPIEPRAGRQPSLASKHRMQIHPTDASDVDAQ